MPALVNLIVGVIIFVIFVFMTVGGAGFVVTGSRRAAEAWRLTTGALTPPSDVTAGEWAIVQGSARPAETVVVAPICGREAVCATSRLEKHRNSRYASHWDTEYETTVAAAFRVADGMGTVSVDPVDPTVVTGDDRTVIRAPDSETVASRRVREFVADAPDTDGVPAGQGVRYRESVVLPDDEILVFGPVETQQGQPTFGGGADLTITTKSPEAFTQGSALGAAVYFFLGGVLLAVPGLFVVFFLVPYLFGG